VSFPALGTPAPDFALTADDGSLFRLSEQRGHPVVIFFYPEDDTGGCTIENQEFSALSGEFVGLGARLVGVSPDTIAAHCKFRDKYALKAKLLADPDHAAIDPYGVYQMKKLYGREFMGIIRVTFIVDGQGRIADVTRATRIMGHAERTLAKLKTLLADA
jgi:peroxiredoxin Q/BCP